MINDSDFYYSLEEFKSEQELDQPYYTECQNCHNITESTLFVSSGYKCKKCGKVELTVNYPFPPHLSGIQHIYESVVESYYRLTVSMSNDKTHASIHLKNAYPALSTGDIGQIIHASEYANDFVVIKEIQNRTKVNEKTAVIESMILSNILSRSYIESTFIFVQTLTLFEMWLSLLIRRVLESKDTNANVINYILDGMRSPDRYLGFIKECGLIKKEEILEPIFNKNSITHSELEKIRNDIIHRGILVNNIDTVQKAVTIASRFLPVFVDIFNRHLVQTTP